MPWFLQLDATEVSSGPGTRGLRPWNIVTFPTVGSASQVYIEKTMSAYAGSATTYADMQEVVLLPECLAPIPATVDSVSATEYGSSGALVDWAVQLHDGDGGWWTANGGDRWAVIDLGGTQPVAALLFSAWDNVPVDFDIQVGDGVAPWTTVATLTLELGAVAPVRFDTIQETALLRLFFGSNDAGGAGLLDVIPFALVIPEPGSVALLCLGALALWRH